MQSKEVPYGAKLSSLALAHSRNANDDEQPCLAVALFEHGLNVDLIGDMAGSAVTPRPVKDQEETHTHVYVRIFGRLRAICRPERRERFVAVLDLYFDHEV